MTEGTVYYFRYMVMPGKYHDCQGLFTISGIWLCQGNTMTDRYCLLFQVYSYAREIP